MAKEHLSFSALEARIEAIPEGPASRLRQPKWIATLGGITMAAVAIGLVPFALTQWMEPQIWMVYVARTGLWIAVLSGAPSIIRSIAVLVQEFTGWKRQLVAQSDHDRAAFVALRDWVVQFTASEIREHRQYAALAGRRIVAKLALIVGGVQRLGVLPVLVALFLLAREVDGLSLETLTGMPAWQAFIGILLVLAYLIGLQAARMQLRLELYEMVLADAYAHKQHMVQEPASDGVGGPASIIQAVV